MLRFESFAAALLAVMIPCAAFAQSPGADSSATPAEPVRPAVFTGQYGHFSPGAALAVGMLATAGPLAVAGLANSSGHGAGGPLLGAAALGVIVGPAIGLSSGGRSDLAERGLGVRLLGSLALAGGFLGAMSMMESDSDDPRSTGFLTLGIVGAVATVGSAAIDLLATPIAVEQGKPQPSAALVVRPDGALAAQVRF